MIPSSALDTAEQARPSPVRLMAPSAVTVLALCAGLTGLIFAADGAIAAAIACVLAAALLDACDGRIARLTGSASKFGAELDSLSDAVCFGAVPAFILYRWGLSDYGAAGWLPCLALAAACALRLARFNVAAGRADRPAWEAAYFTGVPAPGGAFLALSPIYAELAAVLDHAAAAQLGLPVTLGIAALMVSRWPTFSGKSLGRRLSRLSLLPPLALALAIALLGVWRPWAACLLLALVYVASLPASAWRHAILARRLAQAGAAGPQTQDQRRPSSGPNRPA